MVTATLSTSEGYSSWNLAWRMSPKWRSRKPALNVSWLMRIQGISRCPMCITPMAPLMKRWICRSRIGSKSFCSLRPATSMRMPSGITPPTAAVSRSGPMTSILPSSTSGSSRPRRNSKAGESCRPNSTCSCSLSPRSRRGLLPLVPLAQGQDKGEDALLVIEEDLPRLVHVARDEAAERHRRAGGEVEGEHGRAGLLAEGHQVGGPAHFPARLGQLLGHAHPAGVAGPENPEVPLLQLP